MSSQPNITKALAKQNKSDKRSSRPNISPTPRHHQQALLPLDCVLIQECDNSTLRPARHSRRSDLTPMQESENKPPATGATPGSSSMWSVAHGTAHAAPTSQPINYVKAFWQAYPTCRRPMSNAFGGTLKALTPSFEASAGKARQGKARLHERKGASGRWNWRSTSKSSGRAWACRRKRSPRRFSSRARPSQTGRPTGPTPTCRACFC